MMPSTALLLADDPTVCKAPARTLRREPIASGHDEAWLRDQLLAHPELVPIDTIEPGAGLFVPLCRELPLPGAGNTVYLDLLGVTPHGRPVLVECKLWRNPQARREVVAQILEYASLLRRWSYADLTAALQAKLGKNGKNPIYERVAAVAPDSDEAAFVDAVSLNLDRGDFHLIVAGDGIRADLMTIADHIGGGGARLALVELQTWSDGRGTKLVVPHIPFRTEVVRQRLIVDGQDRPVTLTPVGEGGDGEGPPANPDRAAKHAANRAFWQRFIDTVEFDHPDQPPPRHGGNNWVYVPLPTPAKKINLYFEGGLAGVRTLWGPDLASYTEIHKQFDDLKEKICIPGLRASAPDKYQPGLWVEAPLSDIGCEEAQLEWFRDVSNRLVSALRPRLALLGDG